MSGTNEADSSQKPDTLTTLYLSSAEQPDSVVHVARIWRYGGIGSLGHRSPQGVSRGRALVEGSGFRVITTKR